MEKKEVSETNMRFPLTSYHERYFSIQFVLKHEQLFTSNEADKQRFRSGGY
jgi:hypothetical protein